jgi:hypothetical protein
MLSENLQHGVGRNQAAKTGIPHCSKVFARRFLKVNGELCVIKPFG